MTSPGGRPFDARRAWVASLVAAAAVLLAAVPGGGSSLPEVERWVLANGLRVVSVSRPEAPSVTLAVHYEVGERVEGRAEAGFSRHVARLLALGSQHLPAGEASRLRAARGGRAEVHLGGDTLAFLETLPAHEVAFGLWLQSDRMRGLPPDAAEVGDDDLPPVPGPWTHTPWDGAFRRGVELLYGVRVLDRVSLKALRAEGAGPSPLDAFHRRFIVPNNAVLTVVGRFERRPLRQLISRHFGDLPRGEPLPPLYVEGAVQGRGRQAELAAQPDEREAVWFAFPAPKADDGSGDALTVAIHLLFRPDGRLYRRLVEAGLAVGVSGGLSGQRGPRMIYGLVELGAGGREAAWEAVWEELRRLGREGPTSGELADAVRALSARRMLSTLDGEVLALDLGGAALRENDPSRPFGDPGRWAAVRAEDVARAAAAAFDPARAVVVDVVAGGGRAP